jgi:ubiquitin thioesterase OTU1
VVPANNSCLFTAVAHLLTAADAVRPPHSPLSAAGLRAEVAAAVLRAPARWGAGLLERAPPDYAAWIRLPSSWGGSVELAILAELFETELAAIDVQTLVLHVHGEAAGYRRRLYFIYDGLHYDGIVRRCGDPAAFAPDDQGARDHVLLLATQAQRAREYTDLAKFSLRCLACGCGLAGAEAASAHAASTGHINFSEY